MKTTVTYVDPSRLTTIVAESLLPTTVQSGFIRVDGAKGRRLYIANTKRCGRVDLSGFEVSADLAVAPHCGAFGNVKQQLLMTGTEDEVVARFKSVVEILLTLDAVPEKVKAPKAPKAAKVKATETEVPAAPDESISDRMALIKKVAAEKGMAVSSRTLALAEEEIPTVDDLSDLDGLIDDSL